ncbi:NADP-dependent malic enzyme, chloroplastic [Vitis vinifera]|uniref:NADP-dependent malic enzyme, chloroplastic n=1 Tax=Vitis vinifera TaxID=29760 RepID=A0A438FK27_VITVI|nr:NADP-dependent malic enzyme, chloroplastic [Vitis vinifera]
MALLEGSLPVPLGPIPAVYSLSKALISAVIFTGTFFSAAAEIRDTRWFWRRSKTPLQWLLCFPLGTQPLEIDSLIYLCFNGYTLLRDPHHNKGLAFTEKERDAHYLRGLLPPAVLNQDLQEKRLMHNLRQYKVPLQRYMAMMDLQLSTLRQLVRLARNTGAFLGVLKILEVLKNWPERSIQVIVVTDDERILGLGDLGCQGMGIPVGKLSLYTTLGGLHPSVCLPVTIDVGTNNEQLLNDEFYIGLKQRRATGQEYAELLHEFMCAVKQNYGEMALIQFEDFANHNAFELLRKYSRTHLVFNDDIQGTTSVVLARLIASLKLVGGSLAEHTFLFLRCWRAQAFRSPMMVMVMALQNRAGIGIAELIALEISKQTKAPLEETRKKIWLVNSKGLIVHSRMESLQHFKKPWAHEHEPIKALLDAIKSIKPTVLIGSPGVGKTFTKEVVEAMTSFNFLTLLICMTLLIL